MADSKRKVVGFKKFSDIKRSKVEEVDLSTGIKPDDGSDIPMNPNLSRKSTKIEKPGSSKNLKPFKQDVSLPNDKDLKTVKDSVSKTIGKTASQEEKEEKVSNEQVETIGRVAKFPKNAEASKAYSFLESVKVSKKSIWYIMIEKQNNELQMVKYNYKEGVNLNKFVNELKTYYVSKYSGNKEACRVIEKIEVGGNDKFSMVKNIPLIDVDGKKMITVITEDLISLLSK
jgi:hypothetical protein